MTIAIDTTGSPRATRVATSTTIVPGVTAAITVLE
jgi:hypothetical protein